MGEWDNTAFVATADAAGVADALAKLFEASGRTVIDRPPARRAVFPDPMQYGTGATTSRWAAAVLAGKPQWTIVKTAPFELLCEPADGVPRLALLAKLLGCDAFQLNLYDGDSLVLVEANAEGAFRISGFNASIGPGPYHGFAIDDDAYEAGFGLLRVPPPLADAFGIHDVSRRLRELLHGDPDACDNLVQVGSLIPNEPLADALVIYAERTPPRPLRDPLQLPLVVERTEEEARFRLQLPAGELWLESGAGSMLAPRASAEAGAIVGALADWLATPVEASGERVPAGVMVFGDLDDGTLSISGREGGALPIGLDLDEARGRATLRELDATIAPDLVREVARAWTGSAIDCLVPHVERVPIPPHRTVEALAAGDRFVIACSHDARASLWAWRPGEAAVQLAELGGRLEQLARGPGAHDVTIRLGHGLHGHSPGDERDLVIVDVVTGARRTLLERRAGITTFAWSPDGATLAVQKTRALSAAERKRYAEAARTRKPVLGASARHYVQLFDAHGSALARSPDHVELSTPRWVGDVVHCDHAGRDDTQYVTWRPSDDAIEAHEHWIDRSPSGVMLRGDRDATYVGDRRITDVRPWLPSEPLTWLDDDTCVLVRDLDEEGYGLATAVDVRSLRARPIVASRGVMPCGQVADVIVANDRGWRLWWGRSTGK